MCGPSCYCQFCENQKNTSDSFSHVDLLVDELLQDDNEENYVDESEDDLEEWQQQEMNDDELRTLMEFVFGPDSDDEREL